MSYLNSQEQTIYRSLAGQIQLGFYEDGARFPSAKEIARRYQVSYCPAQRALKMLEESGLVRLCRGKETVVLRKPYAQYLNSGVFRERAGALLDLSKSLVLFSPGICFLGLCQMQPMRGTEQAASKLEGVQREKCLYRLFDEVLHAAGSKTILSLYYDIGSFFESAFVDIFQSLEKEEEVYDFVISFEQSFWDCRRGAYHMATQRLETMGKQFSKGIAQYFKNNPALAQSEQPVAFRWTPHKGRVRYCDIVAIDLICKINQGIYPAGTLLPGNTVLADIYHVAPITIRRTVGLLNKLGAAETVNGVGTRVVHAGNGKIVHKFKDLMLDDNLRTFLEALQLLAITCEAVMRETFPYLSEEASGVISQAAACKEQNASVVAVISACLQAVVRCCPLAAVRNIYEELTLLLLRGSVLRFERREEQVPGWTENSAALLKALEEQDAICFSRVFRRMIEDNFLIIRQRLLQDGVEGIEEIAVPVDPWYEGDCDARRCVAVHQQRKKKKA